MNFFSAMQHRRKALISTLPTALLLVLISSAGTYSMAAGKTSDKTGIVSLTATIQHYDFYRPWKKKSPTIKKATAIHVMKNRFLTTADIINNATFLELEKEGYSGKVPAEVVHIDYNMNLALVKPADFSFHKDLQVIDVLPSFISPGQKVQIQRLNSKKRMLRADGKLYEIRESLYPYTDIQYASYKVTTSLESGGWSEAVLSTDGQLCGINMYYFEKTSVAIAIPSAFIHMFMVQYRKNADLSPFSGIGFYSLENPVLREYLKFKKDEQGVLVESVLPGSSADGIIKPGDILLSLNGVAVDHEGNFKLHNKANLNLENLMYFKPLPGGSIRYNSGSIPARVSRNGYEKEVSIPLKAFPTSKMKIPLDVPNTRPSYLLIGGFLFTELTMPYLKEWGRNWRKHASDNLIFYLDYMSYYNPDASMGLGDLKDLSPRRRLVILSHVLADDSTEGMEWVRDKVLIDINGQQVDSISRLKQVVDQSGSSFLHLNLEGQVPVVVEKKKLKRIYKRISENHNIKEFHYISPQKP